jgi:pyruvate kinase
MTEAPSHRNRQTKIVATLGPASSSPERIRALFDAGVDMFRLNFSHGHADDHRARVETIRAVEREVGRPIGILADLQGPKLRLGIFEKGSVEIEAGQSFRLDMDAKAGDATRAPMPHPEIFAALQAGSILLLDDGKVRLRVVSCGTDHAQTIVEAGHKLSDRKGVNVPNAVLPLSPLTEKDRADLAIALDLGADWVALSFVQRPEDVIEARNLIAGRAAVMAKLEKPSAIKSLIPILERADGVMVARGDLGVEMPPEDVPHIQKRILREARRIGKPVIVATQMLESMITNPTPTRAEASDVATAVYDGADAIMLSAETASGEYPIESVAMMDRIAIHTQADLSDHGGLLTEKQRPQHTASDAITAAARQVAETVSAAAIVTYTTSGSTTLRAARERPQVPILGLTPSIRTARRLALSYGVHAVHAPDARDFSDMVGKAVRIALRDGMAKVGDKLVITAGVPFGTPGTTNTLRIAMVEADASGQDTQN